MSRRTPVEELREEESAIGSPIRRSSRIAAVVTRRASATEDTPGKISRSKRLSLSQESSIEKDNASTSTDGPLTPPKKIVTRGASKSPSALSKTEESKDVPLRRTTRRTSTSSLMDEDAQKEERELSPVLTKVTTRRRSTRSMSTSPTSEMASRNTKASTPRKSTRAVSASPTPDVTKSAPPKLRGRRASVTEKIIPLESIDETEPKTEEISTPNTEDKNFDEEKTESAIEETGDENLPLKKKKAAMLKKQHLQTIAEKSFVEESVDETKNQEKVVEEKLDTSKKEETITDIDKSLKESSVETPKKPSDVKITPAKSTGIDKSLKESSVETSKKPSDAKTTPAKPTTAEKKPLKRDSDSPDTPELKSKVAKYCLSLSKSKRSPGESAEEKELKAVLNADVDEAASKNCPRRSPRLSTSDSGNRDITKQPLSIHSGTVNVTGGSEESFRLNLNLSQFDASQENLEQKTEEKLSSTVAQENSLNTSSSSNTSDKENQKQKIAETVEDITKRKLIILAENINIEKQSPVSLEKVAPLAVLGNQQKSRLSKNSFCEPMEVDEYPSDYGSSVQDDKEEPAESPTKRSSEVAESPKIADVNKSLAEKSSKLLESPKALDVSSKQDLSSPATSKHKGTFDLSENDVGKIDISQVKASAAASKQTFDLSENDVGKIDISQVKAYSVTTELTKVSSPQRRSARLLNQSKNDSLGEEEKKTIVNSTPKQKSAKRNIEEDLEEAMQVGVNESTLSIDERDLVDKNDSQLQLNEVSTGDAQKKNQSKLSQKSVKEDSISSGDSKNDSNCKVSQEESKDKGLDKTVLLDESIDKEVVENPDLQEKEDPNKSNMDVGDKKNDLGRKDNKDTPTTSENQSKSSSDEGEEEAKFSEDSDNEDLVQKNQSKRDSILKNKSKVKDSSKHQRKSNGGELNQSKNSSDEGEEEAKFSEDSDDEDLAKKNRSKRDSTLENKSKVKDSPKHKKKSNGDEPNQSKNYSDEGEEEAIYCEDSDDEDLVKKNRSKRDSTLENKSKVKDSPKHKKKSNGDEPNQSKNDSDEGEEEAIFCEDSDDEDLVQKNQSKRDSTLKNKSKAKDSSKSQLKINSDEEEEPELLEDYDSGDNKESFYLFKIKSKKSLESKPTKSVSTEDNENSSNKSKDKGRSSLPSENPTIDVNSDSDKEQNNVSDLDAKINNLIANQLNEDSSSSYESVTHFLDDLAEEGEEDTPSEGSNDIVDMGESVGSTESDVDSDDTYENDSFINDNEENELLSGEEYDLGPEKKKKQTKKRRSRIITVSDSEEENKENELPTNKTDAKQAEITQSKEKLTNGIEEDSDLEKMSTRPYCGLTPPSIMSVRDSLSDSEKQETKEDKEAASNVLINKEDNLKSLEELKQQEVSTKNRKSTVHQQKASLELTPKPAPVVPTIFTPNNSVLEDEASEADKVARKRQSSITIHENIKLQDVGEGSVSDRISRVVDVFCSSVKKDGQDSSGNIALNISLEFLKSPSPSEKATEEQEVEEVFEETTKKLASTEPDKSKLEEDIQPLKKKGKKQMLENEEESVDVAFENMFKKRLSSNFPKEQGPKSEETIKLSAKKQKLEKKQDETSDDLNVTLEDHSATKKRSLQRVEKSPLKGNLQVEEKQNEQINVEPKEDWETLSEDDVRIISSSSSKTENSSSKKDRKKKKKKKQKHVGLTSSDAISSEEKKAEDQLTSSSKETPETIPSDSDMSEDLDEELHEKYSSNSSKDYSAEEEEVELKIIPKVVGKKSKKEKLIKKSEILTEKLESELNLNQTSTSELVKRVKKRKRNTSINLPDKSMQENQDTEIVVKTKKQKGQVKPEVEESAAIPLKKSKKPKTSNEADAYSDEVFLTKSQEGKKKKKKNKKSAMEQIELEIAAVKLTQPSQPDKKKGKSTPNKAGPSSSKSSNAPEESKFQYFPSRILETLTKNEKKTGVVSGKNKLKKPKLLPSTTADKRGWETDTVDSPLLPSKSTKKMKMDVENIHKKDFKNLMLYDRSRVNRMDTKSLLMKKKNKF